MSHQRFPIYGIVLPPAQEERLAALFEERDLLAVCTASREGFVLFDEISREAYELTISPGGAVHVWRTMTINDEYTPRVDRNYHIYAICRDGTVEFFQASKRWAPDDPSIFYFEQDPPEPLDYYKAGMDDIPIYGCPICGGKRKRSLYYGDDYCPRCDIWMSNRCDDPDCRRCRSYIGLPRPARPSEGPVDDPPPEVERPEPKRPDWDVYEDFRIKVDRSVPPSKEVLSTPLERLDICPRARHRLQRDGIHTLGDIQKLSMDELVDSRLNREDFEQTIRAAASCGVYLDWQREILPFLSSVK